MGFFSFIKQSIYVMINEIFAELASMYAMLKMTMRMIKHNRLSNNSSMLDMASRTSKELNQFI